MTTENSLPTRDPRHPNKTVSLQEPRSYEIGATRGPFARSLGATEVTILAETARGGPDDIGAGRR